MSLAQQVQTINDGLFSPVYPPMQMVQVLDNGTQRVVHWQHVRPAVETLSGMSWPQIDPQWDYFLDHNRYPTGQPLDLRPDEVDTFLSLVQNLISQTSEGMRVLSSVQPRVSLTDVSVVVGVQNLPDLAEAVGHIQRTAELAAIDDAIAISSLQPGSLEIFLTAGRASLYALQLAIGLAKTLSGTRVSEDARRLARLWRHLRPDEDVTDEVTIEAVHGDAKEVFWGSAWESLERVAKDASQNPHEARNKVDHAADEIYRNAGRVSADWRLPPAVVAGLPGGLTVSLNYDDPESIGRVIRAISAPQENEGTGSG